MSEVNKPPLISDKLAQEIDRWLAKYPKERNQSAVMGALMAAQKENGGHLTPKLIEAVANYIKVFPMQAMEVATFYPMYEHKPVGKLKIEVCHNISCMLNGADEIVDFLKKELGVGLNEINEQKQISFKKVECLGACRDAPVVSLNGDYLEKATPETLKRVIDEHKV